MAYITVPTITVRYSLPVPSETEFATREEFVAFLWSCFKEPGQYAFDESTAEFNREATAFNANGRVYCAAPLRSKDFIAYWDPQKARCRCGLIVIHITPGGTKTWYLTRDYYMWLNFLPIYDKEEKKFGFAKIRDAQYHLALYEDIAEHSFEHAGILKKRQIASSYFHAGKLLNRFWFEEGAVLKMAGSLKDYINEKGTWRFLEEYRNFLNEHTAWIRPCTPDKVLNWEQKIETTQNGRKIDKGLKSVLIGLVLDKDVSKGVGGPCSIFYHEEAGIAPKMDATLGFLRPALKSGMTTTGMFVVAGSVGELSQCGPLKDIMLNPASQDVLGVKTNLFDESGRVETCALFIPEQWSMLPYIDEFGNSLVEEALKAILIERAKWKAKLRPDQYQFEISQKPINIAEAFAYRKASKFNLGLLTAQDRRIDDGDYPVEYVDLVRNEQGRVTPKATAKTPIREFPISAKTVSKEGVVEIFEHPVSDNPNSSPAWGTYYASVDPVGEGKTTTSESLCSIYVLKNAQEVIRHKVDGTVENVIIPEKIVACWTGRFDDLDKTHERLLLIIQYYNAWTVVENNIALFIQYMIAKRQQRYLVPKDQIAFLKELGANLNVYQEYGWKNTGSIFKGNMLSYTQQFISAEIDTETEPNGDIIRTVYGVERIPDKMVIKEMREYHDGLNVDRLVALTALIAFALVQRASRGYQKKVEHERNSAGGNYEKQKLYGKLLKTPFRHLDSGSRPTGSSPAHPGGQARPTRPRSAFRNLR